MRESDYENYSNYINRLRIEDFMEQIESWQMLNFQETFFFVGFRSRSTALRNFRQFTGSTPSEYFQKKDGEAEEPPEMLSTWSDDLCEPVGAQLKSRTSTLYILIEGVTWSDTLNKILPEKRWGSRRDPWNVKHLIGWLMRTSRGAT